MTDIIFEATAVPQTFVTVYLIVSVPAAAPVTTPADTLAVLLLLHAPPVDASVKVIVEPTHTLESPVIVPASGNGLMVISFVVVAVPHILVTV